MKTDNFSTVRLKRTELFGQEYKEFIQPLFAKDKMEARVNYIQWLIEKNPALGSTEDLTIYVVRAESEPVGQMAVIPVEMLFGGKTIRAGWAIDFYANRKARRIGVGSQVVGPVFSDFPVMCTLGQTGLAFNFARKLGLHFPGALSKYRTLLNHYYTIPKKIFKKAGFSFFTETKRLKSKEHLLKIEKDAKIEELTSFDDCEIPEIYAPDNQYYFLRSQKHLNWRYFQHPFATYKVLRICLPGIADTIAILRMAFDQFWYQARLVELLYHYNLSHTDLKRIMKILISYASSHGMEQFQCQTSDIKILNALPKTAFSDTIPGSRFLYGTLNMEDCPFIALDEWKLFAGDSDVDSLEAFHEKTNADDKENN